MRRDPEEFVDHAPREGEGLTRVDGAPAWDLDGLVEADAEARRLTEQKAALA